MPRPRLLIAITATIAFSVLGSPSPASATVLPTGEVTFGRTVVEPAYDDSTGALVYLSTPMGAQANPVFGKNVAPIYLPVYPVGSGVGTLNCQDTTATTVENCPDHGGHVAGAAEQIMPSVYGVPGAAGVAGHDHLVGIASTGGDFNILWEPVLVLFTPSAVHDGVIRHITTLADINQLVSAGYAIEIHNPAATFNCAVVPASVYNLGTPYHV